MLNKLKQGVKRGVARKVTEGVVVLGLAGLLGSYTGTARAEAEAEANKPSVETKQTANEDYSNITDDWNPITRAAKISRETIFERDTFKWLGVSALVAGAGIATDLDEKIYEHFQDEDNEIFSEGIVDFYDGLGYVAGIGSSFGMQAIGHLRDDKKMKMAGRAVGDATLITSGFGLAVRQITGRNDPEDGKGASSFKPFDFSTSIDDKDFFAGHVGVVAAETRVLQRFYPESKLIPIIGYGSTAIMALTKTQSGDHWLTGNIAGFIMGYHIGNKTADVYLEGKEPAWSFVPTTNSDGKFMLAARRAF